jgi:prepilin-type processing-associated H-X9-DG protein
VTIHRNIQTALTALAVFGLVVLALTQFVFWNIANKQKASLPAVHHSGCQNRLKLLGLEAKLYANEHDGWIMPVDLGARGITFDPSMIEFDQPEELQFLLCPAVEHTDEPVALLLNPPPDYISDYQYFTHVVSSLEEFNAYVAAVAEAKRTGTSIDGPIPMADGSELPRTSLDEAADLGMPHAEIPLAMDRPVNHAPHGFNVLFLDGSVRTIAPGETNSFLGSDAFAEAVDNASLMP